jgi:hypothetical protein
MSAGAILSACAVVSARSSFLSNGSLVQSWHVKVGSDHCLAFSDGESVCVLDNKNESVRDPNANLRFLFIKYSLGLVAWAHHQRFL